LFKQVQSPRHVLSELLQNADDANATEAKVRIEHDTFVFEHDGEDFTEEHFASICRFGYSNKRSLHTIGFRGIGFKSIFSLGSNVDLLTPTLAVRFHERRFTEPEWIPGSPGPAGLTRVCVNVADANRLAEVQANFDEWLKSPFSLLFFRSLRQLVIGDTPIKWNSLGPGPVDRSEWFYLEGSEDRRYLRIRSEEEMFPEDVLAEIRDERMVGGDDVPDLPPSAVEIVVGAPGRLFVVLPTGVETKLPFACNAPFIQDPARLKIKDPETSPTNRWLLARIGRLAGEAMLSWLGNTTCSTEDRARAYRLLPDVKRDDRSLGGICGAAVELAVEEAISGKPLLLTEDGALVDKGQAVIIPRAVSDVWPANQAASFLDPQKRPAMCQSIGSEDRTKLLHWKFTDAITDDGVVSALAITHPPKPQGWAALGKLWAYVWRVRCRYYWGGCEELRIVPVKGGEHLYSSSEVVRLSERIPAASQDDWDFLAQYLLVVDQDFIRHLTEQKRSAEESGDSSSRETAEAAYGVLEKAKLSGTSPASVVIERVSQRLFSSGETRLEDAVRIAHIAAKLDARIGDSFRYVTQDGSFRKAETVLFDADDVLEEILPESDRNATLLHRAYYGRSASCSVDEWMKWAHSERSGLRDFPSLVEKERNIIGREEIERFAITRGAKGPLTYSYKYDDFIVVDWDFEDRLCRHWEDLERSDALVWTRIVGCLVKQPDLRQKGVSLLHRSRDSIRKPMTNEWLTPAWVMRLRDRPCLTDTNGRARNPGDLYRRTAQTEALIGVEDFVHRDLDTKENAWWLDLLGVQSAPTGPERLLDRVRAFAGREGAPAHEVDKWYRRLDSLLDTCSTEQFQGVKDAFRTERLVLAEDGCWMSASAVFATADETDVPGAAVVRKSVAELTLWRKIGVADRPTPDLAVQWLRGLPSGGRLPSEDLRRVRALLERHPERIWNECSHWLNLYDEWTPVRKLAYALTKQSLVPLEHLFEWVLRLTADLQRLPPEIVSQSPFSSLPTLASVIEERISGLEPASARPVSSDWMEALGDALARVEFEGEEKTTRIRSLGRRLAETKRLAVSGIDVIPYIDGTPAGTPRETKVLWAATTLYTAEIPEARLARLVPEELNRAFQDPEVKAALDYSFGRPPSAVWDYVRENLRLATEQPTGSQSACADADTSADTAAPSAPGQSDDDSCLVRFPSEPSNGAGFTDFALSVDGAESISAFNLRHDGYADRERKRDAPYAPRVMERFAFSLGFRHDGEGRLVHPDGRWIERSPDLRQLWEQYSGTGELEHTYWPRAHCLQDKPLPIEAEIWNLVQKYPERYSFVLTDLSGEPVEITGSQLVAMRDSREITIYPAVYRIKSNDNHTASSVRAE
jgi:hypothetical protein